MSTGGEFSSENTTTMKFQRALVVSWGDHMWKICLFRVLRNYVEIFLESGSSQDSSQENLGTWVVQNPHTSSHPQSNRNDHDRSNICSWIFWEFLSAFYDHSPNQESCSRITITAHRENNNGSSPPSNLWESMPKELLANLQVWFLLDFVERSVSFATTSSKDSRFSCVCAISKEKP